MFTHSETILKALTQSLTVAHTTHWHFLKIDLRQWVNFLLTRVTSIVVKTSKIQSWKHKQSRTNLLPSAHLYGTDNFVGQTSMNWSFYCSFPRLCWTDLLVVPVSPCLNYVTLLLSHFLSAYRRGSFNFAPPFRGSRVTFSIAENTWNQFPDGILTQDSHIRHLIWRLIGRCDAWHWWLHNSISTIRARIRHEG